MRPSDERRHAISPAGSSKYSASSRPSPNSVAARVAPLRRRVVAGDQRADAVADRRPAPTSCPPAASIARAAQREAATGEADRRDRSRRRLGFRLAGERIGERRDQFADPRRAGGLVAPVDRREQRAALLAVADDDPQHAGAVRRSQRARSRSSLSPSFAASSGCTSTNGSGRCAPSRGLRPVRVMVCHWSRMRPVLSTERKASRERRLRSAGGSGAISRALPFGVKNRPSAKSRWRLSVSPARARPLHRIERVEGVVARARRARRCRNRGCRRSRTPTARRAREKYRRRSDRQRPRQSPSAAPPARRSTSPAAPRPAAAGTARCREMRRSELVTVPSFSPQAAAGSSTCAPQATVSLLSDVLRDHQQVELLQRLAHDAGARQRHRRVGRHHPQRLDLAARDRLEHLHRLEALALRHVRRAARTGRRDRCRRAKIHMRGELIGEAADLAAAHRIGLAGERERPHAGLADPAGGEMAIDDGVDLVGALRRLVDALREAGDDARRRRGTARRSARHRLRARPVAAAVAATLGAISRARTSASVKSGRCAHRDSRSRAPACRRDAPAGR